MLHCKRQNFHRSKLPLPGAVNPRRKCIVSHYSLCDNVLPYSIGIHTVWVRFLDVGSSYRFNGIWFEQ